MKIYTFFDAEYFINHKERNRTNLYLVDLYYFKYFYSLPKLILFMVNDYDLYELDRLIFAQVTLLNSSHSIDYFIFVDKIFESKKIISKIRKLQILK